MGELTIWDESLFLVYQYIEGWRDLLATGAYDLVPYLIDWDAVVVNGRVIEMQDPFSRYEKEAREFAEELPGLLATVPAYEPPTEPLELDELAEVELLNSEGDETDVEVERQPEEDGPGEREEEEG